VVNDLRTIAITGVDGFVGRHVAALADEQGYHVVGLARAPSPDRELAKHLSSYHQADLRTEWPLEEPVDAVIHLAGLAAVGPSFREPQKYIDWNSAIVTTMCEAIVAVGDADRVRVVGISTGAVYDSGASGAPLEENAPLAASSPYVVSKLLVERQFEYYSKRGLDVVIARPFNHVGPGQSRGFLVPDLAAKIRGHRAGDTMLTGNLSTERDYTDVRDVARAYLLLAAAPSHNELAYNVASGRSLSGQRILALVANSLDIPAPATKTDQSLLRATDAQRVVGSAERLRSEFGWMPGIGIEQSISDYVHGAGTTA